MIEVAKLEKMLSYEMELAKSWNNMSPREQQAYLKAHPLSKFRPGGAKKGPVDLTSHLQKNGFTHQGKGVWTHKNGRTLKVQSGRKGNTHAHHIAITHKNGDESMRRTNSNKRAVGIITRMGKGGGNRAAKIGAANKEGVQAVKKALAPAKNRDAAPPVKIRGADKILHDLHKKSPSGTVLEKHFTKKNTPKVMHHAFKRKKHPTGLPSHVVDKMAVRRPKA